MSLVPTLHIRNVPVDVYDAMRARAKRSGRSLNAEVVESLREVVEREKRHGFLAQLDAFRAEYLAPPDFPRPEEIIRQARDERSDEIARRARRS